MEVAICNPGSYKGKRAAGLSRLVRGLLLYGLCVFLGMPVIAQESQKSESSPTLLSQGASPPSSNAAAQPEQTTAPAQSEPGAIKKSKKKSKLAGLVIAPIPISSPAIGSGIVPVLGYIFPFSAKDKISPPSTIGVAGLVTNNGSRGFAVGGQLFLKENTYEVTAGFVRGNVDYNIYANEAPSNLQLPLEQTGHAFKGEILRRIAWKFFAGPRFMTGSSLVTVRPNNVINFPIPPEVGLRANVTSIGARLTRDTRPNHFYPISGTFFSFTSDFFSQSLGSKYSFQSYRTTFDKYWSLSKKQVLASDTTYCGTAGTPPFYGNCIYGTSNELRGYAAGRYFTRYMLATQVEYRLVLPKGFGLVVFGGLGGVIPGGDQLAQKIQNSHFLPGGGGGLRYELTKKYHLNLRADLAQGVNGHTFAIGIGEAF
jgi:Omp85 superfamily domain